MSKFVESEHAWTWRLGKEKLSVKTKLDRTWMARLKMCVKVRVIGVGYWSYSHWQSFPALHDPYVSIETGGQAYTRISGTMSGTNIGYNSNQRRQAQNVHNQWSRLHWYSGLYNTWKNANRCVSRSLCVSYQVAVDRKRNCLNPAVN